MWLSFASEGRGFVTISVERSKVTVWDASRLAAVSVLALGNSDRDIEAGLSGDGRTVAVFHFGANPSVQLWDVASGRRFATLRPPSPSVAEAFTEGGKHLDKARVAQDARFWEIVRSLAPAAASKD